MKSKKGIFIMCFLCITLILCAFKALISVDLLSSRNDSVRVSYVDAVLESDTLTFYVNYESYGEFFEIAEDVVVATDEEFTNILRRKSCKPEGSRYVYTFSLKDPIDRIYIFPPTLYIPTEISTTSLELCSTKTPATLDGKEWFAISSVSTERANETMYTVAINIEAHENTLPRFPKLEIDGKRIEGISSLNFNEDNNFDFGEFIFHLPSENCEDISSILENASLVVEDALLRVSAKDALFSSNIKSLDIIVE